MRHTGRYYHPVGSERLTTRQSQCKRGGRLGECRYHHVLNGGDEPLLEGKSVLRKSLEGYRCAVIGIRETRVSAVSPQGEAVPRSREARCTTFGLEVHPPRHMCAPEVHRGSEDAVIHTSGSEMCRDR